MLTNRLGKAITIDILLQYDTADEGVSRKKKLRVHCWLEIS
jgi:hypothetical protein